MLVLRQSVIRSYCAMSTPTTDIITKKIHDEFSPVLFEIYNDSSKHARHSAMRGSTNVTESHFRLVVVSEKFQGKTQPARHRMIYSLLKDELTAANGVHALQLDTKTPDEYEKRAHALKY